jgi:hypothetical protein
MARERFTPEQILEALKAKRGMVYLAARMLQCDVKTIYNAMKRHPEIRKVRDELRGQMIDVAESALHKLIANGNLSATIFFLKTQARDRGYVEHPERAGVNLNLSADDLARMDDKELDAYIARLDALAGRA